jgi:hypothetical protein
VQIAEAERDFFKMYPVDEICVLVFRGLKAAFFKIKRCRLAVDPGCWLAFFCNYFRCTDSVVLSCGGPDIKIRKLRGLKLWAGSCRRESSGLVGDLVCTATTAEKKGQGEN